MVALGRVRTKDRRAAVRGGLAPGGLVVLILLLMGTLAAPAGARDLRSRWGGSVAPAAPAQPATPPAGPAGEVEPRALLVLPHDSPLAVDGAGNVLTLQPFGPGYAIYKYVPTGAGTLAPAGAPIYIRRGVYATSLAVARDGTICVGLLTGVDCIDPEGGVAHHRHDLLTDVMALAFAPDGHLWALTSSGSNLTGLQLVRATPDFTRVDLVLTLRQNLQGFEGNGLAAAPDGSVVLPVVENDTHRVLRVQPNGQFTRVADFWRLTGGIAVDSAGNVYAAGIKRPQSVQEQRNPQDVVFVHGPGAASEFAARFPVETTGSRLTGYTTLGADGNLYVVRRQRVRVAEGGLEEQPVLWQVAVGRPSPTVRDPVIDFRIPYIETLVPALAHLSVYTGPVLVGRGGPLTVVGYNFLGKTGSGRVLVGGRPAAILEWNDDSISILLPEDAPPGTVDVRVAIDGVLSDPETMEVKTPDVPGWFQIGTPELEDELFRIYRFPEYRGEIVIAGRTDLGQPVQLFHAIEQPQVFTLRLPNGQYEVAFVAAYRLDTMMGQVAVDVPLQRLAFRISDAEPVVVWGPQMK